LASRKSSEGENGAGDFRWFEEPEAKVKLAGAEGKDGIVEFAGHLQWPPLAAGVQGLSMVSRCGLGSADGDGGGPSFAIELNIDNL